MSDTRYGKKTKEGIEYLPTPVLLNGLQVWGVDEEQAKMLGYVPMVKTAQPVKEGFYYTPEWVEEKDRFVQAWAEHEIAAPEPDPYIARITALEAEIEALKEAQELQTEKILALDTKIEKKIGIEPVEPPVDPIEKEADK